jgi:alkaline phosphatase D
MRLAPFVGIRGVAGVLTASMAFALALALAINTAAAKLVVMHGYADLTSATLWIQADAPGPVSVSWRPDSDTEPRQVALVADAANDNVVVARLTGMKPGMQATYRVDAGADHRDGTVRAQPKWAKSADAATLTFAIGSCFFPADAAPRYSRPDYGGGYEIFAAIAAQAPDLMLWLGDNLYLQYPDFYDPASMAMRYRRQRGSEALQELLTTTAHLAIWDDHDYGPNDSDASYRLKGETLKLFKRYWPNPSFGLSEVPGTFGVARYGDVLFFLLDDRYYRSPNGAPDGPDKTMFGTRQLQWLKQALLAAPSGSLKIVAGGNQFWHRGHRFEGWHRFATERKAFAEWLLAHKVESPLPVRRPAFFGVDPGCASEHVSDPRIHFEPAHVAFAREA